MGPTVQLDFIVAKLLTYLNMKVLVLAEPGHMQFFYATANLSYDQKH